MAYIPPTPRVPGLPYAAPDPDKTSVTDLPCIQCRNAIELLALEASVWMTANSLNPATDAGVASVMQSAACLECMSDTQLEELVVKAELAQYASSMSLARNRLANLPEHRLKALIAYLKVLYYKNN